MIMKPVRYKTSIEVLLIGALFLLTGCSEKNHSLQSPNGEILFSLKDKQKLSYTITVNQDTLVHPSALGLEFADHGKLGINMKTVKIQEDTSDKRWIPLWGTQSSIRNNFRQKTYYLEDKKKDLRLQLIVRAYNDGIAFRYHIPRQAQVDQFTIMKELTQFHFSPEADCWAPDYRSFKSHQEAKYEHYKYKELLNGNVWGTPMLVRQHDSLYAGISEAHLKDWAGMYLGPSREKYGARLFRSPVMQAKDTPESMDLSIKGMKTLRLLMLPVDSYHGDRGDWARARLITNNGDTLYLSDLEPVASIRPVANDQTVGGSNLRLKNNKYVKGISSSTRNEVVYSLPDECTRFQATVGMDEATGGQEKIRFEAYGSHEAYEKPASLSAYLSPLPEQEIKVMGNTPHNTPWRVVMIGKDPGRLIESNLMVNLNPPNKIENPGWIKPGKMAWDHWWSGDVQMDNATVKEYIQFAADQGFPYMLIDWGWYGPHNNPEADVTTTRESIDMPELLKYAKERGVRLWLWLYWSDLDRKMKEAFALYEKWGIAGVKIDFMQRDDQQMVEWYHQVARQAAEHHLMLNFHGAYKPTGIRRTWPNFMTREAVLGNEWNKWYRFITADHNVNLAFTRMLTGPMDYTPGGFLNRTPENFTTDSYTQVLTTRCHQLAMMVVYESPLVCLCDHPNHYTKQAGLEFIRQVPASWDETQVLNGQINEYITLARRSGNDWYIGIMNGLKARDMTLPLDFLGEGHYQATLFFDGKQANEKPEQVKIQKDTFTRSDVLPIHLAERGGSALIFKNIHPH